MMAITYAEHMVKVAARKASPVKPKQPAGTISKAGWRVVGGKRCYFRSMWEANYARYLEWLREMGEIEAWEHEPMTFWFDSIKRGCVSYLPDFSVLESCGRLDYHEVKGFMDAKSKTKIARMGKFYPDIRLVVIASPQYREINRKVSRLIEGWGE